ncbi:MAG: hypothetical protein NUW01_15285 [Gemmatimonadaceae bacterium]|nr:hypothetical protein [Gemmatimonadaceae bacterium]
MLKPAAHHSSPRPARDRWLLLVALLAFALWLAALGPIRSWASGAGLRDHWLIGVAPSFFAGATMALWQAFAVRSTPLAAAAGAVAIVALAEAAQFALPRYTPDIRDVLAGIAGVALVVPLLVWRARRAAKLTGPSAD